MRAATLTLLLLALGTAVEASSWDEPFVIRDEDHNFEIQTPPDSIDWDAIDPDPGKPTVRALFRSKFADTEPLSYADFYVMVNPLPSTFTKMKLDKVAARWEAPMLGYLANPRARRTSEGKLGEGELSVECYTVDVQGDHLAGLHHVTWTIARNGRFLYSLYVVRAYKAVGDEVLEEEIDAIRKSFKFLKVEKVEANKEAKKTPTPGAPGVGNEPDEKEDVDPELLKEEQIAQPFWRFDCVKPEGLINIPVDQHTDAEKQSGLKLKFKRDKPGSQFMIRIYAETDKSRRYTVQQLADSKIVWFKKLYEKKQHKDPVIDAKYDFPMSNASLRLELIGRRFTTEYTYWYIADCKNERQYQIEVYMTGGSAVQLWKDTIEKFLKEFKPRKK